MLPHLAGRALNVVRYPDGSRKAPFSGRRTSARNARLGHALARAGSPGPTPARLRRRGRAATLAWLGNQAAIELHPWTSPIDAPAEPRWALVDIDPGPGRRGPRRSSSHDLYRRALEHLEVTGVPKVSGKRGLQVFIPVRPGYSFEETRDWIEQLSRAVGAAVPDLVSWEWSKDRRDGRARLDFTQNWRNRTLVGAYSARPSPGLPVSAPITWDELDDPTSGPTAGLSARSWRGSRNGATSSRRRSGRARSCPACRRPPRRSAHAGRCGPGGYGRAVARREVRMPHRSLLRRPHALAIVVALLFTAALAVVPSSPAAGPVGGARSPRRPRDPRRSPLLGGQRFPCAISPGGPSSRAPHRRSPRRPGCAGAGAPGRRRPPAPRREPSRRAGPRGPRRSRRRRPRVGTAATPDVVAPSAADAARPGGRCRAGPGGRGRSRGCRDHVAGPHRPGDLVRHGAAVPRAAGPLDRGEHDPRRPDGELVDADHRPSGCPRHPGLEQVVLRHVRVEQRCVRIRSARPVRPRARALDRHPLRRRLQRRCALPGRLPDRRSQRHMGQVLPSVPGGLAGFPTLGYSSALVAVGVNEFPVACGAGGSPSIGTYRGASLHVVDWADLLDGGPSPKISSTAPVPTSFSYVPAAGLSTGDPIHVAVALDDKSTNRADLGYLSVSGTVAAGSGRRRSRRPHIGERGQAPGSADAASTPGASSACSATRWTSVPRTRCGLKGRLAIATPRAACAGPPPGPAAA